MRTKAEGRAWPTTTLERLPFTLSELLSMGADPFNGEVWKPPFTEREEDLVLEQVEIVSDADRLLPAATAAEGGSRLQGRKWLSALGLVPWVTTSQILKGHDDDVRAVAFSPDSTLVVSGSNDKTVRLWNTGTGELIRTFNGVRSAITSIDISPDGMYIVSGSGKDIARLWNVETGDHIRSFEGWKVRFSPNGTHVATASGVDHTSRLWNIGTGQRIRNFKGHRKDIWSVHFFRTGAFILSTSGDGAFLWNVETGQHINTFAEGEHLRASAISPDEIYIVTASKENVHLWNANSGALVRTFGGGNYWSVKFSLTGEYLAIGLSDGCVQLWKVETGQLFQTLTGHTKWITSIDFSQDGAYIATASGDNTVRVWKVDF